MIKLTFCLRRKVGLSREEFQTYWYTKHAPLVAKHAETLRITRYVQTHAMDHEVNAAFRSARNAPEGYDGVAELWWDTIEDLMAALETEAGRNAAAELLDDEARFIDHQNSPLWISNQKVIVGDAKPR